MKTAHFFPVKSNYLMRQYAELYLSRIVSLHEVPKTIISDRGPQFVSRFWTSLHKTMNIELLRSSTYHPQTRGQAERVNQVLEYMLCACAHIYGQKWDVILPFAEFSYNNSYQASIKMSPFEALYGHSC